MCVRPEALHDPVEEVGVERVDEVQRRRAGADVALELDVLATLGVVNVGELIPVKSWVSCSSSSSFGPATSISLIPMLRMPLS